MAPTLLTSNRHHKSGPDSVYAEELFPLGHGFPLWDPDTTKADGEVFIGDVGFIEHGTFYRMFNAIKDKADDFKDGKTPHEYEQFELVSEHSWSSRVHAIQPGSLHSKTVSNKQVAAHLEVSDPTAAGRLRVGGGFEYQCDSERAAVLVMKHSADRESLHRIPRLEKYLLKHWRNWHEFIQTTLDIGIEFEDLLFIVGTRKTVDWAVASCATAGGSTKFHFDANATAATGSFSVLSSSKSHVSLQQNWGPQRESNHTAASSSTTLDQHERKDQCVFLNYYKMKRRIWFGPKVIKAAAGDHQLPRQGPDDCRGGEANAPGTTSLSTTNEFEDTYELTTDRPALQAWDPVTFVLDYILRTEASVELAIAADRDINELCKRYDCDIPQDIAPFLDSVKPPVTVNSDGVGMLFMADSSLDAEDTKTVSMLESFGVQSHQPSPEIPWGLPEASDASNVLVARADNTKAGGDIYSPKHDGLSTFKHCRAGGGAEMGAAGITAIAYSPDGRYIASGGDDALVIVWNPDTGAIMVQYDRHEDSIRSLEFSPDSQRLVSGANDSLAIVWSVESGDSLMTLEGHTGPVCSTAYSPDGALIATGSVDKARLWDASSGVQRSLSGGGDDELVISVAFSPDSNQLVSASADYCARVWDVKDGQLLHLLEGHEGIINTITYAPDSRRLATGSDDGSVRIWDPHSGLMLVDLREHTEPVWAVGFSTDGRHLLSAASDGSIKLCDSYGGERLHEIDAGEKVMTAVTFSADGTRICASSTDNYIRVWNAENGVLLKTIPGQVNLLQFSPDTKHVAWSSDDGLLLVWSIDSPDVEMATVSTI